jgi:hypothetical protein
MRFEGLKIGRFAFGPRRRGVESVAVRKWE